MDRDRRDREVPGDEERIPDDPFLAEDPAAREREARRQARKARWRDRGEESRRSLGERVSEARASGQPPPSDDAPPAPPAPPAPSDEFRRNRGQKSSLGGGRPPRGPRDRAAVVHRRRLAAGGIAVAVVLLLVIAIAAIGGGGGEEGPATLETADVTIPEGLSRDQIAAIASEAGLRGNYRRASRSAGGFNPRKYGAESPDHLEGFLFPATYELEDGARAGELVRKQLDAFEDNIGRIDMSEAESRNLNTYDVLKIASMIEREVMVPKERRMVAGVIYNRLSANEPLGIDATIRYEDGNYEEPLTDARLEEDSPFNTRLRAGLPPTPIGNPGLATIRAAAKPADTDAFFYVVKPGTCGEHLFTADAAEFERAAARYQRALEREGGSPTDCPDEG